jgi:hypothetical protein
MHRRALIRLLGVGLLVALTTSPAMAQESRTDKIYDEILLEVSEVVPEFAGVLGGGTTLKILVTEQRSGMTQQLREALDRAFGTYQFEDYTNTILLDAKYTWIELMKWYRQILESVEWGANPALMGGDIDERENRLVFEVPFPMTQAALIKKTAERLGIPSDAVFVGQGGPVWIDEGEPPRFDDLRPWLPAAVAAGLLLIGQAALIWRRHAVKRRGA